MSEPIEIPIIAPFDATGANAAIRAFEQLKAAASGYEQAATRQSRTAKESAAQTDAYARSLQRASREAISIAQAQARAMAAAGNYEGAVRKLNTALQQAEVVNVKQGAAVQAQITRYDQAAAAANQVATSSSSLSGALAGLINPATLVAGAFAALGAAAVSASNNQRDLERTQNTLRALAGSQELYNSVLEAAREQQKLFGGSLRDNIDGLTGIATLARSTGADLKSLIDLSQRLSLKDPSQGIAGARIALQEALTGDPTSLARRYEIPKAALAALRDESISTQEKLQILDQYLNDIGISSAAVSESTPALTERINQLGAVVDQSSIFVGTMINGLAELALGSAETGKWLDGFTKDLEKTSNMYGRMFELIGQGIPIQDAFSQALNYAAVQADQVRGSMDKAAVAIAGVNAQALTFLNLQGGAVASVLDRNATRSGPTATGATRKPGPRSQDVALTLVRTSSGSGGGGASAASRAEAEQRKYEAALARANDAAQTAAEKQADYEETLAEKRANAAETRAERLAGIETNLQDKLTDIRANAASKQADLEQSTATRIADIRKGLAQRIADIERQQQQARADATRGLMSSIAGATASSNLAAQVADVTNFTGGGKADQQRMAAAQARQTALQSAAAEAQAYSDPSVGAAAFQARQQQISTLEDLDQAYAEKRAQYASDPRALQALQQQYDEAKAAAEAMVQLAVDEAQQAADLRAQQAQQQIDDARKAAEEERKAVLDEKRRQTEEIAREAQAASDKAIVEAQRQRDEVAQTFADQQEAIAKWADDAEKSLQKVIDKADEASKALRSIKAPSGGASDAAAAAAAPAPEGRASGGPVAAGVPYIVGERGPEWIVPRQHGMVYPTGVTPGGGSLTANITIQGGGMPPQAIADSVIRELDRRARTRY